MIYLKRPKTRLEYLRRVNFMSQKDVAEYLGISQVSYGKIESGKVKLSVETAQKLVHVFKCSKIEDLIEDTDVDVISL